MVGRSLSPDFCASVSAGEPNDDTGAGAAEPNVKPPDGFLEDGVFTSEIESSAFRFVFFGSSGVTVAEVPNANEGVEEVVVDGALNEKEGAGEVVANSLGFSVDDVTSFTGALKVNDACSTEPLVVVAGTPKLKPAGLLAPVLFDSDAASVDFPAGATPNENPEVAGAMAFELFSVVA